MNGCCIQGIESSYKKHSQQFFVNFIWIKMIFMLYPSLRMLNGKVRTRDASAAPEITNWYHKLLKVFLPLLGDKISEI